jgi:hypothetical protein
VDGDCEKTNIKIFQNNSKISAEEKQSDSVTDIFHISHKNKTV